MGLWITALSALLLGPAAAQPAANPAAAVEQPQTPLPGANSFAESQARAAIVAKGFGDVSPLVNDSQGIWRGTARKDNRTFDVSVDYKGHVDAR
jgi:putative membrane protein